MRAVVIFLCRRLFNLYKQLLISSYDPSQDMKSVSLTGKQFSASIVNCIRHEDDAEITNRLYTYKRTIRSPMIDITYSDFIIKNEPRKALESNNSIFCNFKNNTDQELYNFRSTLS